MYRLANVHDLKYRDNNEIARYNYSHLPNMLQLNVKKKNFVGRIGLFLKNH